MDAHSDPKASRKRIILENIGLLGIALLVVLIIRSSFIEAFKIPSGSMIPTLLVGDHIFVDKLAYGLKVPFSEFFSPAPIYLTQRSFPKRGDIIVFKFPKDNNYYYIKRVVGLPGDTVEVRNKQLYLNHKLVVRQPVDPGRTEPIFRALEDPKYTQNNIEIFEEQLDDAGHLIIQDKNSYIGENHKEELVPANSFFVMGDNRDFSNDSRFWGNVPVENIRGKAVMIWFSIFSSFSDGQFIFHPERIGIVLH